MTDNEIVKALECCCKNNNCEGCPLEYLTFSSQCASELAIKSLDLINRQKEEKEALINGQETLQKHIAEQKAEIERLKKSNRNWRRKVQRLRAVNDSFTDIGKLYSEIKSEAYKEFAERLKDELEDWVGADKRISYSRIENVLDNVLKEMIGE